MMRSTSFSASCVELRRVRERRARGSRAASTGRCGAASARRARARTASARARSSRGRASARSTAACAGRRAAAPTCGAISRHELDRARAGADHRDALAGEVVVVVPARRVERACPRTCRARGCRAARAGAARRCRARARARRSVSPLARRTVPRAASLRRSAPRRPAAPNRRCGAQPVLVGAALEVREDLGLLAERARPRRVRLERERVEVRRHVARGARIGVVAPGAADARRPSRGSRSRRCPPA